MESTNVLLLVLVATLVVSFGIAAVIVRGTRAKAARALAELGDAQQTMAAAALGRSGPDQASLTGTGTLVLTADEVAFAQWRPERLVRIPRRDLVRVDTVREHLGKSMKSDVLRLCWRSGDAPEESVAFFVRDLDPWLRDLGGHRGSPEA